MRRNLEFQSIKLYKNVLAGAQSNPVILFSKPNIQYSFSASTTTLNKLSTESKLTEHSFAPRSPLLLQLSKTPSVCKKIISLSPQH